MRTLKFRAWDNVEEIHKEVNGIDWEHDLVSCKDPGGTITKTMDTFELEEFTGIKDIKTDEIFENDLVEMESIAPGAPEITGVVKMIDGEWIVDNGITAESLFQELSTVRILGYTPERQDYI